MADIPLNSINVHVDVVLPEAERVRKPQDDRAHPAGSDAAAELRSAVLRMDIGELDGVNVADELARERDEPEFDWPVN